MKSMKLMKSRHSNTGFRHSNIITFATTSLARRALLLLSVLMMSVGSAWGATITTGTPTSTSEEDLVITDNKFTINGAKFQELISAYPKYIRFTAYNSLNEKVAITSVTSEYRESYYHSFGSDGYVYGGTYEAVLWSSSGVITVTLPDGVVKLEIYTKDEYVDVSGDFTEPDGGTLITYTLPVADPFESSLKAGGKKGFNLKDHDNAETSSVSVDFSKALESLGSTPKYARFILKKNGAVVDPTGILTITDVTPAVQTTAKPKQGFYLYNSGGNLSTSGVSVTLNATDYSDYQVVCMLSTDAAKAATENVVTEEPEWDLEYTYYFDKLISVPVSSLSNPYLQLNIHNDVLTYFGKTEEEMKDGWHADWYVRDKQTKAVQPLQFGNEQVANVWSMYIGYRWADYFDGKDNGATRNSDKIYAGWDTADSKSVERLDAIRQTLGFLQVYAPTAYASMQGASDYEIVYDITDEYAGGMPVMKMRFVFQIPAFENEPNVGMVTADKPQTVTDRAAATFTLGDMPADAKYARFYLVDKDDTPLAPGTILSVTGGTACGKPNSGLYLYNDGSVLSPTVTIAAPKAYKIYKVVGLFSTSLTDITLDGTTMVQEPKWDMQYTYTFDYTITTYDQTPQVEWNATAMGVDASTADIEANWNTSLTELGAGQCIKWYVVNGSSEKQPLALGTTRAAGTWNIGLAAPFAVAENVATLSNQSSVTAEQLAAWVTTNIYAPSEATYAEVASHKIVCEVYTNNAGTGNPNARYTFSIHKGFVGSLKSAGLENTERIVLTAGAETHTFGALIRKDTKYARFYLTDKDGTPVDPTGKLTATSTSGILTTVDGYSVTLGRYRYMGEGVVPYDVEQSLTLTLPDATLDQYHVVAVTSKDAAVVDGSGNVTSEPDWDTQTTYWFKYPVSTWNTEDNIEWSAQSMQIAAPAIETQKETGYLETNKSHYTMQWMVVDKNGNAQNMRQGSGRVNDYWSVAINGDPFTLSGDNKQLTLTNDDNLSVSNWNKWAAPVFYAPANMTMREIAEAGITFVCKFYEDENAADLNDELLAMKYIVYIDRSEQIGELKDGGKRGSETITPTASPMTIDLTDATAAFASEFGGTPRYARVYLTKSDGTLIDPTEGAEQLGVPGATGFTTKTYGYYLSNESGITLPTNATLTLPNGKFNFYHVVVALSADTGESGHVGSFSRESSDRAATVATIYEPDYDYVYTIKFADTSTFPGTLTTSPFSHSKEVLVKDESVKTATLTLADSKAKILSEYLVADWATLRSNFHIRWYVVKKNDEGDFEKIPNSELYLTSATVDKGHQTETDQGLYWNSVTQTYAWPGSLTESDVLNVTINRNPGGGAPELTGNWEDYKVIAVMTKDLTGQTDDGGSPKVLTHEPNTLDMIYRFSFFKETQFQFVHDTGAGTNVFMKKANDARINAAVQQYSWDNGTSSRTPETGDVRQWVHTMEYDVYVDPSSSTPVMLHLPFEKYTSTGNNLEPAAYIRWYDWATDINNNRLTKVGTRLVDMTETNNGVNVSRGFFFLNNDENGLQPTHDMVGVTFNPNGVDGLVTIACDVSKYYDGIYSGSTGEYLMHEPTLSTRYIFNIRPASVIAGDIKIGQQKFEAAGSSMFDLAEDNGRVCVSMKNTSSEFTVRSALPTLDSYYFYDGSTLVNANKIAWVPYYVDEDGSVWKFNGYFDGANTNRIKQFIVSSMTGTYLSVADGTTTKTVTVGSGTRIHLVGFLYNEGGTKSAPVVHYELNFMDAPAYAVSALPIERTEAYLKEHMTLQDEIIFDDVDGAVLSNNIASQLENHTNSPMDWNKAQYGFCYPDVRRIWTGSGDPSGISPIHGDYMLLRSMNQGGISPSDTELYYKYHWYVGSPTLHDYTKTMGGDYGTFLYVDASDESRTIARMRFNANLCAGSELCFTGAIANMTTGTNPQVMTTVYAVNSVGKRTRVVSFHSTELSKATATSFENGIWYQIYGRIPIPATTDLSDVDHYEVDIDNYALDTNGADYCVDQLMFFTSNAKLKVKQSGVNCGDVEIPLNLYVTAESIEHMASKTIFWRICDADGNALTDASLYNNGGKLYGQTSVPATIPATLPAEVSLSVPFSGYFEGADGVTYFSLANKGFALKEGVDYYISVYNMGETSVSYESLWGNPANTCSVFSPVFVPKMMYLTMKDGSGNLVTTVAGGCSDKKADVNLTVILNMPDEDEVSGFKPYDDVPFDFFLGSLAECNAYTLTGKPSVSLVTALKDFRGFGSATPNTTSYANKAEFIAANSAYASSHADYYNVIIQAFEAGLLFMDASATFNHTIQGNAQNLAQISALPIKSKVNNGVKDFDVCSPLEFVFTVNASGNGPSLTLGFADVTSYPDAIRVIRVGKEQLANMQKDGGFLLHIPVNTFKKNDSATPMAGTLQIEGDLALLAYSASANHTSDDQITAKIEKVATFADTEITSSKMYISLNFHGASVTKPTFQEGFAYRMFFQYKDKDGGAGACEGSTEFLLKVVPEFVTWNGTSAEWNDDANWKRSSREVLNKGAKGSATNTATAGHPDGYEQNGEGTLAAVVTTPNTYVPMKFTYVTLPAGTRAPNLVNLAYDSEKIYNNMGTGATTNIQYDLMVRYTEQTCQDHGVAGDVYDCEKYYGNWAKELYLKPNAELLNQQYLTYEKVWVEKELDANTWTLMSTPLQNTYAGDMYVPNSATAAENGRQLTEAFQPINFNATTYSRTKYPIYQKGWTQQGVYVYTKTNDIRQTKYSANIPGGVSTLLNQWSHEYNDVTVPYSTWKGFAIRAHKKNQSAKALIRLPKADTSYDYYQWDNTSPTDGQLTQNVDKTTTGKLLTDGTPNNVGVTYGTVYGTTPRTAGDGHVDEPIAEIQSSPSNYQLVGNPYLCSIDMTAFLSGNTANLEVAGYWTYNDNNTGSPVTTGVIAPMQSFFVKAKDGATAIAFTPSMMVDGSTIAPSREFTLTAINERGQSAASISVGEEEKSVNTLFDSNLADVPMVYTVANGYAVSINQVKELTKPIAFGVTCSSNDLVEVTFSDIEQLTDGEVTVVDAVSGQMQPISEGDTFSVEPNDYGRYFLIFANTTGIETTLPKQDGTDGEKVIFDLQGRRVIYPGKGVYIVNGKKYFMK